MSKFAFLTKLTAGAALAVGAVGCEVYHDHPRPVVVERDNYGPPPVVVETERPRVEYVEETEVVRPYAYREVYFVGGAYYYWHPTYHRYVKIVNNRTIVNRTDVVVHKDVVELPARNSAGVIVKTTGHVDVVHRTVTEH